MYYLGVGLVSNTDLFAYSFRISAETARGAGPLELYILENGKVRRGLVFKVDVIVTRVRPCAKNSSMYIAPRGSVLNARLFIQPAGIPTT